MKKCLIILMLAAACFISGCAKEEQVPQSPPVTEDEQMEEGNSLEDYMISVKDKSDEIKDYLMNEASTQMDMNEKSGELYALWDEALNHIWDELKARLTEEEFDRLLEQQREWIVDKETKVEEAGKEVEGGSIYPLIVNSEAAKLTEERVYELYELME